MGHNSSLAAVYTNMLCNDDLCIVDKEFPVSVAPILGQTDYQGPGSNEIRHH